MTKEFLISLVSCAALTACAQTANVQGESEIETAGALEPSAATSNRKAADIESGATKTETAADEEPTLYWLKYGMTGLFDANGKPSGVVRKAGPHTIFETKGDFVKISDAEDHWVRRRDLSEQRSQALPPLKTGGPDRPVTQFPNLLEEEAARRGIDLKKNTP